MRAAGGTEGNSCASSPTDLAKLATFTVTVEVSGIKIPCVREASLPVPDCCQQLIPDIPFYERVGLQGKTSEDIPVVLNSDVETTSGATTPEIPIAATGCATEVTLMVREVADTICDGNRNTVSTLCSDDEIGDGRKIARLDG